MFAPLPEKNGERGFYTSESPHNALPTRTIGRLIGIVGGAIRPIPVGAPASMSSPIGWASYGTADNRARGESRHRIPPAIIVSAIAGASVTIAAMAMPIARAMITRAIVWAMMRTIARPVMSILHLGHAGRLQGRTCLQDQWLRNRLNWPRCCRIDGRNGKQNTQGGG